jgi:hypothetical protein
LGIQYSFTNSDSFRLEAFADSSFGSEPVLKSRSQTGYIVYLGGGPVDWSSTLQTVVALSSAEAEFIAAFSASRNISYFRELLSELTIVSDGATIIWEDNTACIAMSKNPINHKNNKHILRKYHYLRDLVDAGIIRLEYIVTADQVADLLTKPVPPRIFLKLVHFLVRPIPS